MFLRKTVLILCLSLFSITSFACVEALAQQKATLSQTSFKNGELTKIFKKESKVFNQAVADLIASKEDGFAALLKYEAAHGYFTDIMYRSISIVEMHTSEALQEEAEKINAEYNNLLAQISTRKDLYALLEGAPTQDSQEAYLKRKILESFQESGIHLPAEVNARVSQLYAEYDILAAEFNKHLEEVTHSTTLYPSELASLSEENLANFEKDEHGNYIINLGDFNQVTVIQTFVKDPAVRKKVYRLFKGKGSKNVSTLEKMIALQQESAKLKGKNNYAEIAIKESSLANSPYKVVQYLEDFKRFYKEKTQPLLDEMLRLKKKEQPHAKKIMPWDIYYYDRLLVTGGKDNQSTLDQYKVYFPYKTTLENIFKFVEDMMGLRFEEEKDFQPWATGVSSYKLYDKKTGKYLGRIFFDLFKREGKNPSLSYHNPLLKKLESQNRQPEGVVVSNLVDVSTGEDALLTMTNIRIILHELAHAIDFTLADSPSQSINKFVNSEDALEIPSTFFEKLIWEPEVMARLSSHHKTGEKMSLEMATQITTGYKKGLKLGILKEAPLRTLYMENGIFLTLLDISLFTESQNYDSIRDLYNEKFEQFYGVKPVDNGAFLGTFFHLSYGYSANFYLYYWASLYASSIYKKVIDKGALNPEGYMEFRKKVLEASTYSSLNDTYEQFLEGDPDMQEAVKMFGF